jgi:hypothetical protein
LGRSLQKVRRAFLGALRAVVEVLARDLGNPDRELEGVVEVGDVVDELCGVYVVVVLKSSGQDKRGSTRLNETHAKR